MTLLEQYTQSDATDHEKAKLQLAYELNNTTYDSRKSGRELAESLPVSESTVRDLIAEVRRDYGIPVYSFGSGYFKISTVDEFERAINKINEEITTRENTKQELAQAWNQ